MKKLVVIYNKVVVDDTTHPLPLALPSRERAVVRLCELHNRYGDQYMRAAMAKCVWDVASILAVKLAEVEE